MAFLRRFDQEGGMRAILGWLHPYLAPGEALVGLVMGTSRRFFRSRGYLIGVTPERLLLLALDKRWQATGEPPVALTRGEITRSVVWGWGESAREFPSSRAEREIRFETATTTYRFMILGGTWVENVFANESHLQGLDALIDFLLSAEKE